MVQTDYLIAHSRSAEYCDECVCMSVCLCICLSVFLLTYLKTHVQILPNFLYMLLIALARCSFDGGAIRYALLHYV